MAGLFARKCHGDAQKCETPASNNTLAICLAVIIPVVIIVSIVGFFAWKAYRRNKKEFEEDDDNPDFNGDNIIMPDYPEMKAYPAPAGSRSHLDLVNVRNVSNMSLQRPPLHSNGSFANSMEFSTIPFAESMNDISKFSKSLGYDYEDFNYPIRKINATPSKSSSRVASVRSSFSENSSSRPYNGREFDPQLQGQSQQQQGQQAPTQLNSSPLKANVTTKDSAFEVDSSDGEEDLRRRHSAVVSATTNEDVFADAHEETSPDLEQKDEDDMEHDTTFDESFTQDSENYAHTEEQPARKSLMPTSEPNDEPLSQEEEERLNRMKSVYQVYFSRGDSIKRQQEEQFNTDNLPALPQHDYLEQQQQLPEQDQEQDLAHAQNDFIDMNHTVQQTEEEQYRDEVQDQVNELQHQGPVEGDQEGDDQQHYRASVSSSIYISNNGGQLPHQQFQQYSQPQQMYPNPGDMGYQHQPQYYPQQQQYYQNGYPPQQPQYYQQPSYDQYYDQGSQYTSNSSYHPLPDARNREQLPAPSQLSKRTSTLETFTTFNQKSKKQTNPLLQMARADERFNPIEHAAWQQQQQQQQQMQDEVVPSPSQLRQSVVMMNPVSIQGKKVHQYKGTAKQQVRMNNAYQMNNGEPLYGFVDGFERPHGAENLIPRSNSQIDLRRELDNANV